jgi:hypothetical protein
VAAIAIAAVAGLVLDKTMQKPTEEAYSSATGVRL